jgi:uncharacterized protein YihD (DUF1040 family)
MSGATNRLQELLDGIIDYQRRLQNARTHVGTNPKVQEEYENAIKSVENAREAVHRLGAVFNKEN